MTPAEWTGRLVSACSRGREHRLFVREQGDAAAPPLLFLHGFPTSSLDWAKVASAFPDRRCVLPDLLGFGRSDKPAIRYSYGLQADLVCDVLGGAGVRQVDIVAHDYAVTLAQELLRRQAAGTPGTPAIGRVVFLNGGVFGHLHRQQRFHRLLLLPLVGSVVARRVTPQALTQGLNAIAGRPDAWSAGDGQAHWESMAANDGLARLPRLLHYIADRRRHGRVWERAMAEAEHRIAFVWGPADPVSGQHVLQAVVDRLPNAPAVALAGVGHYPHWEAAERTADAIRGALDARAFSAEVDAGSAQKML